MTLSRASTSDVVLVTSLAYLAFDICCEWEGFASCPKPIHHWLLVSYGLLGSSRIAVSVANSLTVGEVGSFLVNSRQKGTTLKMLFSLIWLGLVPLFIAWSGLGTIWTWQVLTVAPRCMPTGMHLAFLMIWQVLSYAWIIVYLGLGTVAFLLERRVRLAEADLQDLEDPDVVQRWGHVSRLDGYTSLPARMTGGGLAPAQIKALGGTSNYGDNLDLVLEDCPICLNPVCVGDTIRQLGGCKHAFHRSCLDLWLLRSRECPMCKCRVLANQPDVGSI